LNIPKGRKFYRAQVAHADVLEKSIDELIPGPALPERMSPLADRASEGRVNPKGIPCLYMASDEHTAIAEVRPWIGSRVSIGIFETIRDLRIVDCSKTPEMVHIYDGEPSAELRAESVWSHIARSFREPVTRNDDIADYAPTQIIAEVFRTNGFDGIVYRSGFGTASFNVALFDVTAAHIKFCAIHMISDVVLKSTEITNPYYVKTDADGSVRLVRNVITEIRPVKRDK